MQHDHLYYIIHSCLLRSYCAYTYYNLDAGAGEKPQDLPKQHSLRSEVRLFPLRELVEEHILKLLDKNESHFVQTGVASTIAAIQRTSTTASTATSRSSVGVSPIRFSLNRKIASLDKNSCSS